MNENIEFTWNGKTFNGSVVKNNDLWWVELDNNKSYLLAKDDKGWFCPSLKRHLAELMGAEIQRKIEFSSIER